MSDPKVLEKRSNSSQKVVQLIAHVPHCKAVSVTGDFAKWSEEGIALVKGPNNDWKITLKLAPGEYQYRLRADGHWRDHSEATKRIQNPFGTENCVLVVD